MDPVKSDEAVVAPKPKPKHFDEQGRMLPDIEGALKEQFMGYLVERGKALGGTFIAGQGYAMIDDQVYRVALGTPSRSPRMRASRLGLSGRQFIKVRKAARKRVRARARAGATG